MSGYYVDQQKFWTAVKIWLKNSHVVNRRLSGVIQMFHLKLLKSSCDLRNIKLLSNIDYGLFSSESIEDVLEALKCLSDNVSVLNESNFLAEFEFLINDNNNQNDDQFLFVIIQKLLPRTSSHKHAFRIALLDISENLATFVNISEGGEKFSTVPPFPYSLKLLSNEISLMVGEKSNENPSVIWLKETLLPRLLKWATSDNINKNVILESSVHLVSLSEYNDLYQRLKVKYGQAIVKVWPETTDPSKFVYEDVAIATYLLLLWKKERQQLKSNKLQSFIDLGCGNGLLVYILCSEGHLGKGIDIRKRGIWDMYPEFVKLEVDVITPSEQCTYEDTDWIIGNHSDELTPWIPVIAARNSYNCRFFLLPCCAYEFDGSKYQRQNSSLSQYNEYLNYVKTICEKCGIDTAVDRLRIPSTKRICFVGTSRLYKEEEHESHLSILRKYVEGRCQNQQRSNDEATNTDNWNTNFKPRESEEKVKNCTKVERSIVNSIIKVVSTFLLAEENNVNGWNAGKVSPLNEIVKLISENDLKALKSECGGLQTLLKNNHHIFEVTSGRVKLRYPRTKAEVMKKFETSQKKNNSKNKSVLTKRPCWFFNNHPNGCPLTIEECSYLHE